MKLLNYLISACIIFGCLELSAQAIVDVPPPVISTEKIFANKFANGFAEVQVNGKVFFIDPLGKRAFDRIDDKNAAILGNTNSIEEYDLHLQYLEALPKPVIKVWKDGLVGLLNPKGEWVLPPEYDDIDVRFSEAWKLTKQGKESYYGKEGVLIPFFDEVDYLDGTHFDVREGEKWGIYNRTIKKMVVPTIYEKFDYCGGCGQKSDYVYTQNNEKWGIVDFQGKVLIDFNYDHEHWGLRSDEWIQSFTKDGKRLLVHIPTQKEYPLPSQAKPYFLPKSMLAYAENGKYGIINKDGSRYLQPEYDDIHLPNENNYLGYQGPYSLVKKAGKVGVLFNEEELFQPEWDEIMIYDDFFVLKKEGKSSLWNAEKQELVPPIYSEIAHIQDYFYSSGSKGVTAFKIKEKALYGFYIPETNTLIPPTYHSVQLVDKLKTGNSLIECVRQGQKALYSLKGQELLPLRYNAWSPWYDDPDLLRIKLNDKWGLYDSKKEKEVISCEYDLLERLGKSTYVLTKVGDYESIKCGIRSENGEVIVENQYKNIEAIGDNWHLLSGNEAGKLKLFNSQNGKLQALKWEYAWKVGAQNLLLVSEDGFIGSLYDVKKGQSLKGSYDVSYYSNLSSNSEFKENSHPLLFGFQQGVAKIHRNKKIGFVDSLGKQVSAPQYDAVSVFNAQGIAAVGKRRAAKKDWGYSVEQMTYGFINKKGQQLSAIEYPAPSIYFTELDYFWGEFMITREIAQSGYEYTGLLDVDGKVIFKSEYDDIHVLNDGDYFLLKKGYLFGIADRRGRIILPVKFENVLIDRYAVEQLVFPVLCKEAAGWRYYSHEGKLITVEGMQDTDVFEINQSLW